jgi:hypothetical protein
MINCAHSLCLKHANSSSIIKKLIGDQKLIDPEKAAAVAFFYFDFTDPESHTVDNALRRIVLQLSAYSPQPYKTLATEYMSSKGQTWPTYDELLNVFRDLLIEIGRTYIILDALDECKSTEHRKLVGFVSTLQQWIKTPLHLLITSQPRDIFLKAFRDISCITLDFNVMQKDIECFVASELSTMDKWPHREEDICKQIICKSNGMQVFFLCSWP